MAKAKSVKGGKGGAATLAERVQADATLCANLPKLGIGNAELASVRKGLRQAFASSVTALTAAGATADDLATGGALYAPVYWAIAAGFAPDVAAMLRITPDTGRGSKEKNVAAGITDPDARRKADANVRRAVRRLAAKLPGAPERAQRSIVELARELASRVTEECGAGSAQSRAAAALVAAIEKTAKAA